MLGTIRCPENARVHDRSRYASWIEQKLLSLFRFGRYHGEGHVSTTGTCSLRVPAYGGTYSQMAPAHWGHLLTKGTCSLKAPAHEWYTCSRKAPALEWHLLTESICSRRAPAHDEHLLTTGTCSQRYLFTKGICSRRAFAYDWHLLTKCTCSGKAPAHKWFLLTEGTYRPIID